MNKEKQIEEMAITICPNIYGHYGCDDCDLYDNECCLPFNIARSLTDKGYRKQSENAVELPCKVGDFVRFKGLETPWKVSAIHIYEEGQPQITITSETEKITCTMTVDEFHMFRCVIADTKMKGGE